MSEEGRESRGGREEERGRVGERRERDGDGDGERAPLGLGDPGSGMASPPGHDPNPTLL